MALTFLFANMVYNIGLYILKKRMRHKLESRLLGEISITSDMQMMPPLWQKSKEELKSLLIKVKKLA